MQHDDAVNSVSYDAVRSVADGREVNGCPITATMFVKVQGTGGACCALQRGSLLSGPGLPAGWPAAAWGQLGFASEVFRGAPARLDTLAQWLTAACTKTATGRLVPCRPTPPPQRPPPPSPPPPPPPLPPPHPTPSTRAPGLPRPIPTESADCSDLLDLYDSGFEVADHSITHPSVRMWGQVSGKGGSWQAAGLQGEIVAAGAIMRIEHTA